MIHFAVQRWYTIVDMTNLTLEKPVGMRAIVRPHIDHHQQIALAADGMKLTNMQIYRPAYVCAINRDLFFKTMFGF